MRTHKRSYIALGFVVLFYLGFGAYLTLSQESVVYQPWPQDFAACSALEDARRVDHSGTRMYVKDGERGMVVLYHGNAGSACDRAFYAEQFTAAGYGYALVEYAGYSNDLRQTTHELVRQDVRNTIAYLEEQGVAHVLVVGESIGSGAAAYHTSIAQPDKLLLIAPFTTLPDVAQAHFWYYPAGLLVQNAFDNPTLLSGYARSVTIIHGTSDGVIPHKLGQTLYESLPTENKAFVSIPNHGHNDLFQAQLTWDTLQDFLED